MTIKWNYQGSVSWVKAEEEEKEKAREGESGSSRWSLPPKPARALHWREGQNLKPMQMWSPEPALIGTAAYD